MHPCLWAVTQSREVAPHDRVGGTHGSCLSLMRGAGLWGCTAGAQAGLAASRGLCPRPELCLCPQSRSDFIAGRMELALSLAGQEACLSLAVLDMLRIAKEKWQSPKEVFSCVR